MESKEKVVSLSKSFVKDVKELKVFQRSYDISLEVHKASLAFPKIEQYALADQMRRTSKSICANLAEGFAKQSQSKLEFKSYITIALGSANEMKLWLSYSFDLCYIDQIQFQQWEREYDAIIGMLINLRSKI